MAVSEARRLLTELAEENGFTITLLEPAEFDAAIIGMCYRMDFEAPVVAYDKEKVIQILQRMSSNCSREDAEEWFEFNTLGAWMGDGTPVFVEGVGDAAEH